MRIMHCLLAWFFLCKSICYVVTIDKEFFSQSFTDSDFVSWSIGGTSPPSQNLASVCAGDRLFGGTPSLIQATVSSPAIPSTHLHRYRERLVDCHLIGPPELLLKYTKSTVGITKGFWLL
jgi:hypothetical protein